LLDKGFLDYRQKMTDGRIMDLGSKDYELKDFRIKDYGIKDKNRISFQSYPNILSIILSSIIRYPCSI
jgi:hypothetical protein